MPFSGFRGRTTTTYNASLGSREINKFTLLAIMDEQEIVPTGTEEVAVEAEVTETPDEPATAPEAVEVDWEARAKKAEALIVKNKQEAKAEPAPTEAVAPQPANVEEVVLRANGMEDEVLTKLKVVAKANGTDLLTAQNDELFTAWKDKFESGQKKAKAALGASNGSGGVTKKDSFKTPNISADDHKAMFNKAVGR